MQWIKKAPTPLVVAIVVVVGVASIAYLAGYVYLTAQGQDTTDYRALLNTSFNYIMLIMGGTATVASVSAARSASNAEDNSNGTLTERDARIAELEQQLDYARRHGS
jgi:hypothetical protein